MTTPYKAAISAAIEFLTNDDARDLLGLHRIRVGGELMTRGALADLLQASLATAPQRGASPDGDETPPVQFVGIDDTQEQLAERERFEQWWLKHGQFCRAGGGNYEKTFAFRAWQAALQERQGEAKLVAETEVERTAPERIYLQIGDDMELADRHFPSTVDVDVSWCAEQGLSAVEVEYVRANLAAPPAAVVPEGFKLVPLWISQRMVDAGDAAWMTADNVDSARVFRAMLDAAPTPQAALYTHADVTDAHTKGYLLGLKQLDRGAPQAAQAVALTDEQITTEWAKHAPKIGGILSFARAIERTTRGVNTEGGAA